MDSAAPLRTRKPRGQGPSRRGEILEAAKRIFLQEGVERATMRRIAAAVGVSPTALYVYFPDKLAILDAISTAMFDALLTVHAQTHQADRPPLDRLRAGLHAYVELARSRPDEYRLTFEAKSMGACHENAAAMTSFSMLQENVAELMQAGLFREDDTMTVSEALWACLHGVALLLLNQPEFIATPPETLVGTVIEAAIRGFGA